MLRDPEHVFRRMWATEGWAKMVPGSLSGAGSPCWGHPRDNAGMTQPASTYFDETLAGEYCAMNWYEGNPGILGLQGRPPTFSQNAPALFGADNDIGSYCQNKMRREGLTPSDAFGHAGRSSCFSAEQHENSAQNVKNVDFDGGNGLTAPSSNDNDDGTVPGDFGHDGDERGHLHHDHLGHGGAPQRRHGLAAKPVFSVAEVTVSKKLLMIRPE